MTRDRGSVQDVLAVETPVRHLRQSQHTREHECVCWMSLGVLFDCQRASETGYSQQRTREVTPHERSPVMVELNGIEPMTSGLQSRRSPS